jgi:hypothetical protein
VGLTLEVDSTNTLRGTLMQQRLLHREPLLEELEQAAQHDNVPRAQVADEVELCVPEDDEVAVVRPAVQVALEQPLWSVVEHLLPRTVGYRHEVKYPLVLPAVLDKQFLEAYVVVRLRTAYARVAYAAHTVCFFHSFLRVLKSHEVVFKYLDLRVIYHERYYCLFQSVFIVHGVCCRKKVEECY